MARAQVSVAGSPSLEARLDAAAVAARIVVAEKVKTSALSFQQVTQVAAIFPPWQPGLVVATGDIYAYAGTLVECVQGHTTQADWQPDKTPALWKMHRDPNVAAPWVQPTGAQDAYALGAKVTHNGKTWTSNVAANVWEPPTQWTEVTA